MNAIADGTSTTVSYINNKIDALEKQKNELVKQKQKYLLAKSPTQDVKQFEDIISMWPDMSLEQKHDIASMLISEVKVFADEVNIMWKYNFDVPHPFHV